uniref:Signal recognition particle subunit FFH/SRP54 (Srp54) n=1 Tax=Candidatus Kentrum sp. DK TaxID=2126562 RepID=A0A450SJ19_9GAMM|nr:MAG: hypothetical protein BECKDK2373C_GA0170839_103929 [Candidatus Kentron sp. DK]
MKKYLLATIAGLALASAGMALLASEEQPEATDEHVHATSTTGTMMPMMHQMRQQMAQIQATTDTKKRQQLMAEHMQSMQAMMSSMMGGGHMMGKGMMGKGMQEGRPGAMGCRMSGMMAGNQMAQQGQAGTAEVQPCPMTDRMTMMEQRLDTMQGMMDQMLQHQAAAKKDNK